MEDLAQNLARWLNEINENIGKEPSEELKNFTRLILKIPHSTLTKSTRTFEDFKFSVDSGELVETLCFCFLKGIVKVNIDTTAPTGFTKQTIELGIAEYIELIMVLGLIDDKFKGGGDS